MNQTLLLALAALAFTARGAPPQEGTAILRMKLERDTTIDGIRCAPTGRAMASVFSRGGLASCPIAQDSMIANHHFAAGTWIYLTEERTLRAVWLNRDTELQGVSCKGAGYKGWSTEFYRSGALKLCYPAREMTVDGVPCRKASFWAELFGSTQAVFHETGHLRSCSLAAPFERPGVRFEKRDRIDIGVDGRVTKIAKPPHDER